MSPQILHKHCFHSTGLGTFGKSYIKEYPLIEISAGKCSPHVNCTFKKFSNQNGGSRPLDWHCKTVQISPWKWFEGNACWSKYLFLSCYILWITLKSFFGPLLTEIVRLRLRIAARGIKRPASFHTGYSLWRYPWTGTWFLMTVPIPCYSIILKKRYFCKRKQLGCRVARNFCGSIFLQIGDFLCFAETNFCD